MKAYRLKNLTIDRVDLVDRGANPKASILITKRAIKKDGPSLADVHVDRTDDKKKKPKEKPMSKLIDRLSKLLKTLAAEEADTVTQTEQIDALKAARASLATGIEAFGKADHPADHPVHGMRKQLAALDASIEKAEDDADEDELEKARKAKEAADAMPSDMAKRFTALEKRTQDAEAVAKAATDRATAAEAIAKSERDTRINAEHVTLLKSFGSLSVDVEKDAPLLRKLADTDKAAYDFLIAKMRAADVIVAKSKLFETFGTTRSAAEGSAWAQIEAKADQLVDKSTTPLTREQAIDKVMSQHPELVKQYRAEQNQNVN